MVPMPALLKYLVAHERSNPAEDAVASRALSREEANNFRKA
jgi:hypothetical protein